MAILMPGRKLRNLPMPLFKPREGGHAAAQHRCLGSLAEFGPTYFHDDDVFTACTTAQKRNI